MTKPLTILLLLLCGAARAQQHLSLEEAIAKALKRNFDINIADLAAQQAARNNTLGNAGFSPYVFLNASVTESRNNVRSDLASGAVQNNPRAVSSNYNPYLVVNWTIFDGGKMFLVKKELGELEAMSQVQLKAQMQTVISRTIQTYAQVVLDNKQVAAVSTALALAKVRMQISDIKFRTGAGAKIDYLQARVDYNARQSDSLTFIANLTQARDSLSVLMGENDGYEYEIDDSLDLNTGLQPLSGDRVADVNLNLSVYRYNAQVSHLNAKIANTYFLPTVALSTGYNYSHTSNSTGFALFSQSYGPSGSLTFSLPIFEGGNLRRQSKVASLQAMRDDLLFERQNTILGRQYRTAWRNYELSVAAYKLEHENITFAKENLDVQVARFKVGIGTTLEARQAENDYVTALQRLYTAAYNLKVDETIVLELENQLVK
ncbi:MAG: TolC family protein [Flavipsychrobacter sp.]|nr:TolC family protein [Flavipsychrobacter sp.]